jgi:hypothetical protein
MALNQSLVQYGTAGGTAINVDHSRIDHAAAPRYVTLSASYAITDLPGQPWRPGFTGAAAAGLEYPRTIASSARILVSAAEAAALVAAGKAAYS